MDNFYVIAWLFLVLMFPFGIITSAIGARKQNRTARLGAKIILAVVVYLFMTLLTAVGVVMIVTTIDSGYIDQTPNIEKLAFIALFALSAWLLSSLVYGRLLGLRAKPNLP
jgi:sulfite exporter TauE/SafE